MGGEVVAGSWSELWELLFREAWNEPLGRFRSPYAFRGNTSVRHRLETALSRLGPVSAGIEGHLLRNFRKYAFGTIPGDDTTWNWLALAQHHGLPTRLLDWSFSPFVAMHFATARPETFAVDGVIWMVDYVQTNRVLPPVLQDALREEGSDVFTAELLARVAPSLEEFDRLAAEPFVLFLDPPSLDARIVNQAALFSVMSSSRARLYEWLGSHPDVCWKVIIPAELKWEIRDKLDQGNITERVLFPGLDGLSAWLRRYYTDRRSAGMDFSGGMPAEPDKPLPEE